MTSNKTAIKATKKANRGFTFKSGVKPTSRPVGRPVGRPTVKPTMIKDNQVWNKQVWLNCILPIGQQEYFMAHTYALEYLDEIWTILTMHESEPLTMINRHTWLGWCGQHVRIGIVPVKGTNGRNKKDEYELLIFDNDNQTTTEPIYRLPLDSWNCDDDWKMTSELGLVQGYSWLTKHEV